VKTRVALVHPAIRPVLEQLMSGKGKEGWLLPRLSADNYGARSDAASGAFGRLKRALGFGPEVVFHSIRKRGANDAGERGCVGKSRR
jgi:hypothetical protein